MGLSKRQIDWALYALFVAAIMAAPLIMEAFWLNRVAKYLVYGMLGVAIALSWGYAGILNLGQGLFFGGRRFVGGGKLNVFHRGAHLVCPRISDVSLAKSSVEAGQHKNGKKKCG